MARNTGKTTRQIRDYEVTQRMLAFDNFPPSLRRALAHSDNDWSVRQCHIALHGGGEDGITPRTADELVALIEHSDARRRAKAMKT